jgi:hypothetical protein
MLSVILLGLLVTVFFALRSQRAEREARETRAWARAVLDSLGRTTLPPGPPVGPEGRDSIYWQWVGTSAQMQSRRLQREVGYWKERRGTLLGEADLAELRTQGFEDPAHDLRDSLIAHPDLIPYRTESSRPSFVRDRIVLLERPYVFAYF